MSKIPTARSPHRTSTLYLLSTRQHLSTQQIVFSRWHPSLELNPPTPTLVTTARNLNLASPKLNTAHLPTHINTAKGTKEVLPRTVSSPPAGTQLILLSPPSQSTTEGEASCLFSTTTTMSYLKKHHANWQVRKPISTRSARIRNHHFPPFPFQRPDTRYYTPKCRAWSRVRIWWIGSAYCWYRGEYICPTRCL